MSDLEIDHAHIQLLTGTAAENEDKDSPTTADKLTEEFDKVILQDEPCKSTTVSLTPPAEVLHLYLQSTLIWNLKYKR